MSAVTLRADAERCVLSGDSLHNAVARKPAEFQVRANRGMVTVTGGAFSRTVVVTVPPWLWLLPLAVASAHRDGRIDASPPQIEFVDALGQVAFAEELEVSVTKLTPPPASTTAALPTAMGATESAPAVAEAVGAPASADAAAIAAETESAAAVAEAAAGPSPRLREVGSLRVLLKKGTGMAAVDLNGKSDPFAMLTCGEQEHISSIKLKTCNPVWNEEMVLSGTLLELISHGLRFKLFDADAEKPRPDKDESLGEVTASLACMRHEDSHEFALPISTKGVLNFSAVWEPPGALESPILFDLVPGEERVVVA